MSAPAPARKQTEPKADNKKIEELERKVEALEAKIGRALEHIGLR